MKLNSPSAKDDADIASEQEQYARDEALRNFGRYSKLRFTGACHWCGESVEGTFCDVGCRADYEKDERVRKKTRAQGRINQERPNAG